MAKTILSQDQVKRVAQLAGLELTEKEVAKFQKQLSQILDYVDQLNEVNAKGVEPTSQVTGLENVFREDEPGLSLPQGKVLSGARKKSKGFFMARTIFE